MHRTENITSIFSCVPIEYGNGRYLKDASFYITCFQMITRTMSEIMTITSNTRTAAATVSSDLKAVGDRKDAVEIFYLWQRNG